MQDLINSFLDVKRVILGRRVFAFAYVAIGYLFRLFQSFLQSMNSCFSQRKPIAELRDLGASSGAPAQGKLKVILILADDQDYGDLSCHGDPILKTPALDSLNERLDCGLKNAGKVRGKGDSRSMKRY